MKLTSPPRGASALPWFLVVALAVGLAVAVSQVVESRDARDRDRTAVGSVACPGPAEPTAGVATSSVVARPAALTPAPPRSGGAQGNGGDPPRTVPGTGDTRPPPGSAFTPVSEKFAAAPVGDTRATAAHFRPWLDQVFKGTSADYAIECRGVACKMELLLDDLPDKEAHLQAVNDLMTKLQADLGHDICAWQFGPTTPGKEPVSGRAIETLQTYFEACDETKPDAGELLGQIFAQLEASGAAADCGRRFPERGRLVVQLVAGPEEGKGKVVPYIGGELAGTGAGNCIEARLRQLADAMVIPDGSGATVRRDITL